MSNSKRYLVSVVILIFFISSISAQIVSTDDFSIELLQKLREQTANDAGLTEELRTQVLEQYDSAIRSMETANNHLISADLFENERGEIDQKLSNLNDELERTEPPIVLTLPDAPTVEDAENALARERARLEANMEALGDQQSVADDMSQKRSDSSLRLGNLDLRLELLNKEYRDQRNSLVRSELKQATGMNILAQQEEVKNENLMLHEKLALFTDLSPLNPLYIELAKRRVAYSEEMVAIYESKAYQIRIEQANNSLEKTRNLSRIVAESYPQLTELATDTEMLAESLWGQKGVLALSEETEKAIIKTRNNQIQMNRITELTIRKFEAYGHRGSLDRWWPQIPEGFPKTVEVSNTIRSLKREIPEVEHTLITFEQDRTQSSEYARQIIDQLQNEFGESLTPSMLQQVRSILSVRQNLLDELIQRGTRYSNQLAEYKNLSETFIIQLDKVESFLYSNLIWSRSVPKPLVPGFQDLSASFKWLVDREHLKEFSKGGFKSGTNRGWFFVLLVILTLLILFRGLLKKRLHRSASIIADPEKNGLRETFKSMIVTGLLAAPIPIIFLLFGILLNRIGASYYWHASARAFSRLAGISIGLELLRLIFSDRGLAESHFGWPTFTNRKLGRRLFYTELISLPLLYIALVFAFAGIKLDSSPELQVYNNALGRITFIISTIMIGFSILTLMRPEKEPGNSDSYTRVTWPRHFSRYAFPTILLGAYPIITLTTIIPAIMAASGYYITALLLANEMQKTFLLVLLILLAKGLIQRISDIQKSRYLAESNTESDTVVNNQKREESNNQVTRLLRFAVMTVFVIGLISIWSEALPLIQIFKRVQLIPSIEILEAPSGLAASMGITPEETSAPPASNQETIDSEPVEEMETVAVSENITPTKLTLWTLLQVLLLGALFFSLMRNLPGVIGIILKRRTNIDSGAIYAASLLIRYSIAIIGMVTIFRLLGIPWSKVQWLAAALTFGLGFGLQEIVANFVSGLILLVERPVRVGDVVTIGTMMGRVTRIQIRATTITLWDRSEMIVPNKDFITTKLINWTLSDSKRRIDIAMKIAYGSDLEKVKTILQNIAEGHPMVLKDPEPYSLVISFGDDSMNLELRFVVDFGNGLTAKDEVQTAIDREFKENGIGFALPQIKVRLPETGD